MQEKQLIRCFIPRKISWVDVDTLENKYPVHFVFILGHRGNDRLDKQFDKTWRQKNSLFGEFHYYRLTKIH
jgi:lysozyme